MLNSLNFKNNNSNSIQIENTIDDIDINNFNTINNLLDKQVTKLSPIVFENEIKNDFNSSLSYDNEKEIINIEKVNKVIEKLMDSYTLTTNNLNDDTLSKMRTAGVKIVEQPARCALRFRYECEGRSAGSIPGQSTTPDNKTYPTIQVLNYKGPAVVVVSCVTKDYPYRPHPHNLVGKEGCKKGVCTMVINNSEMVCSFTILGIQCVKRKDIEDSLKLRETIKVDPFRTGFGHKTQASNIDLNVVRLCFQVFIEGNEKDKFTVPLQPIVSEPIYDKKAMSDLVITKLSHCSAPVTGGKEIILLCDRVTKDDVQIRFFEEKNGQIIWDGLADMQPNDVHKQVAISFRTPRYYNENIQQPILVYIQLRRPSDGQTSEPRPFQFLPREHDPEGLVRKRQKIEEGCLNRYLRDNIGTASGSTDNILPGIPIGISSMAPKETFRIPRLNHKIKLEAQNIPEQVQSKSPSWSPLRTTSPQQTFHQHQQNQLNANQIESILKGGNIISNMNIKSELTDTNDNESHVYSMFLNQANDLNHLNNNNNNNDHTNNSCNNNNNQIIDANGNTQVINDNLNNNNIIQSSTSTNNTNTINNILNNNIVENTLSEKLDSLDLDIDPNDLINDINFNNMMVLMDSGNNITFNSSGNINMDTNMMSGTLSTPQILDISDNAKNILNSNSQLSRLQSELLRLQNVSPNENTQS